MTVREIKTPMAWNIIQSSSVINTAILIAVTLSTQIFEAEVCGVVVLDWITKKHVFNKYTLNMNEFGRINTFFNMMQSSTTRPLHYIYLIYLTGTFN